MATIDVDSTLAADPESELVSGTLNNDPMANNVVIAVARVPARHQSDDATRNQVWPPIPGGRMTGTFGIFYRFRKGSLMSVLARHSLSSATLPRLTVPNGRLRVIRPAAAALMSTTLVVSGLAQESRSGAPAVIQPEKTPVADTRVPPWLQGRRSDTEPPPPIYSSAQIAGMFQRPGNATELLRNLKLAQGNRRGT